MDNNYYNMYYNKVIKKNHINSLHNKTMTVLLEYLNYTVYCR